MSKLLQQEKGAEAIMDTRNGHDTPTDTFYSEEMSRAAVGRLLDDDDGIKAPSSSFVSGFDRSPPKPQPKAARQAPRTMPGVEKKQDMKEQNQLLDMPDSSAYPKDQDLPRPTRSEVLVERSMDRLQDRSPERVPERALERAPDMSEERAPDRAPRPRRERPTSRLVQNESSDGNVDVVPRDKARPPRADAGRFEASAAEPVMKPDNQIETIAPPPGQPTSIGTPARRPSRAERIEQAQARAAERSAQQNSDEPPSESVDYDAFRQRFNPGELVSPPRNTNRPVRAGQARDVRKDRIRTDDKLQDTLGGYIRYIFIASAVAVVLIIAFLSIQVLAIRSARDDAMTTIEALQLEVQYVQELRGDLITAENNLENANTRLNTFEEWFEARGIDTNEPLPELDEADPTATQTSPGAGTVSPVPPTLSLPRTHVVAVGDTLSQIVQNAFGNAYDATMAHVMQTNNITNPNRIMVGQAIQLTPMN